MQVFLMPNIFLEFGYTASKLQSFFGERDQKQRSSIAKRRTEIRKKNYYKCFNWALDFGLDQGVKSYNLLGAMKPKDKQCY